MLLMVVGATLVLLIVHDKPTLLGCDQLVVFEPKPDITAYELAEIESHMTGYRSRHICVSASDPIPDNLARHFRASGLSVAHAGGEPVPRQFIQTRP